MLYKIRQILPEKEKYKKEDSNRLSIGNNPSQSNDCNSKGRLLSVFVIEYDKYYNCTQKQPKRKRVNKHGGYVSTTTSRLAPLFTMGHVSHVELVPYNNIGSTYWYTTTIPRQSPHLIGSFLCCDFALFDNQLFILTIS